MTKVPFSKPSLSPEEQASLLQSRGMRFNDIDQAIFYLQHINYYRLGAYWLPFEENPITHKFKENTEFNEVINLYNFDRELRLLIIDAIERIEISLRTQWTQNMSHIHGSHSYIDQNLVTNSQRHSDNLDLVKKEVFRSKEIFICHARNKYKENLPAIWAVSEIISLGLLSKFYTNLKFKSTKRSISKAYKIDERVFGSWIHHLTHIRNICAHHSRLWNRDFVNTPMIPKNKTKALSQDFIQGSRKIYNTLIILLYMMDIISPDHRWRNKLKSILINSQAPLNIMGFPDNWQYCTIWK